MPPALRITATKSQVPSGRAAPAPARSQFPRVRGVNLPRTPHPARRAAASPPPRFRSAPPPHAPPAPANPLECSAPRRPLPPCSGRRSSLHTAPPASRPTTRSDATGEALREAVEVIGHHWLAPFESDLLERASGKRVSSRAELARAAAFGVAGSSGTFSTPDRYST